MTKTGLWLASTALALSLALAAPAQAQDIDFGDDASTWANDGQCDDPRFEGPGAAAFLSPVDEMHDATDCQAAFEAGDITLKAPDATSGATVAPAAGVEENAEIDFGDDSGLWANDGECDDPRFGGGLASHEGADASDCRAAYEAGEVTYSGDAGSAATAPGDIDFGDDSGTWANDGECDDPRFGGALQSHEFADASDCRAAYEAGEVTYSGGGSGSYPIVIDGIDFGDDSGSWSNDGECDDPRFVGTGVGVALDDHEMADATDCSTAYQNGTVELGDSSANSGDFRINFGDDSSANAFDGICDDPRFQGRGGAMELRDANMMADATDCRAAYDAETVTYNP
ncbi:hypothetical protein [Pelagibacterium lacus]|uniref:Uncharacterized protein n=1 Tax=Pelagibacterium lacus TaxID=2282655 RepID=A0A369W4H9_9HYPH|nr:hypothetical protein [Pelagibacterium lacus]RDE09604.1 hypothetical protein DVH29_05455 [Pelagibacterium lacus]